MDLVRSSLITVPLIGLATAFWGTLSILVAPFSSTGRTQHAIARIWSRWILIAARVRVEVEGLERIPPGESLVFAANHRSFFDIPAVLPALDAQFRFLAKRSLFYWPFIGYHLRKAGHLPVNFDSARESLKSMTEAAKVIRERAISILLFPEAGRAAGPEMDPFKDGAAFIAIRAGVPIVPIGIVGTEKILKLHGRIIRPGVIRMRVGDPIPTLDIRLEDRGKLTAELRARIEELLLPAQSSRDLARAR